MYWLCENKAGKVVYQRLVADAAVDLESKLSGGRVILACRDLKRAQDAADDIRRKTSGTEGAGEVLTVHLDLSSLDSVRECAQTLLRTEKYINILINNAGVCLCPKGLTKDGFEMQFGVNHLGHFLFTNLLLPRIIRSAPARIIIVSSHIHVMRTYSTNRLHRTGVTTYALDPGPVATEALRHVDESMFHGAGLFFRMIRFGMLTPKQGAQTSIYCAVDETVSEQSGFYYRNCQKTTPSAAARDPVKAKTLWDVSVRLVGLGDWDPFTADDVPSESVENTKF
ncbi:hypothetical protein Cfor_03308 [Coptotermes formosanus]|uniref:Uncharacterized protein n=1 Tax=Coptotermes formosanus TaxID=36987 RepID=A0A6L2PB88_COPFO|nr:hypothetical protein Cfor_03308 [Coptotermes formosanus]